MAKVNIKSEKITPFGGIFHVRELFCIKSILFTQKLSDHSDTFRSEDNCEKNELRLSCWRDGFIFT